MRAGSTSARWPIAGLVVGAMLLESSVPCTGQAQSQSVTLRSGNGLGPTDSTITVLGLPVGGSSSSFQPADFVTAQTAPAAWLTTVHPLWTDGLTADPDAKWISTIPDGAGSVAASGLYALSFTLSETGIASARLDFHFAVDNFVGFGQNEGLFVNGLPVPATQAGPGVDLEAEFLDLDVSSQVQPGLNHLYVYAANVGDSGGVLFSATLTVEPFNAWSDLGNALPGSSGTPGLTGTGTLQAGGVATLALTSAKPFAPSWLVVGVSQLNAPFKGGVMVPNPDLMFALTTDFFGASSFGGLWPAGVSSGFTAYFQWWIQDLAGPKGFAASNALAGTTP